MEDHQQAAHELQQLSSYTVPYPAPYPPLLRHASGTSGLAPSEDAESSAMGRDEYDISPPKRDSEAGPSRTS